MKCTRILLGRHSATNDEIAYVCFEKDNRKINH